MTNFFECMYYWDEFAGITTSRDINFISYKSNEKRADSIDKTTALSLKNNVNNYCIIFNYDNDTILLEGTDETFDLRSEVRCFLNKLNKTDILILDITSMNIRVLGALLNSIKFMDFNEVFCIYTEPYRYKKVNCGNEEYFNKDAFELYKKFKGITPIPGFLRGNDNNLNEKWVVFLGFEEKRLLQINENYNFDDIVPVVTMPCFKPGWQNYVFCSNMDFLKSIERKPEYIPASSYLAAYKHLERICNTYKNYYIRITPLGTKINALGALLFSLNNKSNVEILYDNPKDEVSSDDNVGKTYVFDISEIIKYEELNV